MQSEVGHEALAGEQEHLDPLTDTLFISRAGADVAVSDSVAQVLETAGYNVILQQRHFANKSFMQQMQAALDGGARVVALLSREYLASDYCSAEWQSVLADDPLNKKSRLIVLRIGECSPPGLLKALAYWDLVAVSDPREFERIVLEAARGGRLEQPRTGVARPTGTVTFLFTDIEDSTKRWERFGNAMRDAIVRHDALLRRVFGEHEGYVFKTVGDGFRVAFSGVPNAVRAAIAAQQLIAQSDWSTVDGIAVRMAIHVGATDDRDGDYFGPVVNRVGRLLSTAHGGQIVLSAAARSLAQAALPPGASLVDLGTHRLKDLSQPEAISQLNTPGLRSEFPPLLSLDAAQTNLPAQVSPLLGRDREVEEIAGLLRSKLLVTLAGMGGIGKTRIACQVGAELLAEFPDGVWFIDLAPITDRSLVASTLAATFAVSDIGSSNIIERVVAVLMTRRLLLILDNCEHIVDAAAALADALLRGCSGVKLLVTTREALKVPGEHLYRVPSLPVPGVTEGLTAEAALKFGAVELFVARITSISKFTLTDENAPVVADICKRLDGIALAIELAASRVKSLSPRQVAQRLDERFRMLTGGSRTALPRQQTLRALIDWSHDLLDDRERTVFRRVGVFAASFDLAAAVAACADDVIDEWDILDLLDALVDKSLVAVEPSGEERRYRLFESMREYARERFRESGEEPATRGRWFEYYQTQARERTLVYRSKLDDDGLNELEIENDNFRSLLEWSIAAKNDPVAGLDLAGMLADYWMVNGLQPEGFQWLHSGLELVDEARSKTTVARAWLAVASLGQNLLLGKSGLDAAQRAARLGRECDLPDVVARGMLYTGLAFYRLGEYAEADDAFAAALEPLRAVGDRRGVLNCLILQAGNAAALGREEAARQIYDQILTIHRETGNVPGMTVVMGNLALLEFTCGNVARAIELSRECIERARANQEKSIQAFLLVNLAAYLIAAGSYEEARGAAREAVELGRERRYAIPMCIAIEHLALIAAISGEAEVPAQLIGFTQKAIEAAGFAREPFEQRGYERLIALLSERLQERALADLQAQGRALNEQQAALLAQSL